MRKIPIKFCIAVPTAALALAILDFFQPEFPLSVYVMAPLWLLGLMFVLAVDAILASRKKESPALMTLFGWMALLSSGVLLFIQSAVTGATTSGILASLYPEVKQAQVSIGLSSANPIVASTVKPVSVSITSAPIKRAESVAVVQEKKPAEIKPQPETKPVEKTQAAVKDKELVMEQDIGEKQPESKFPLRKDTKLQNESITTATATPAITTTTPTVESTKDKNTLLAQAILQSHVKDAISVLADGANPDYVEPELNRSMLWLAIQSKQSISLLNALLKAGAKVNAVSATGRTALTRAVELNQLEGARLLIAARADVNLAAKNGLTAVYLAADSNNIEILKLLISNRANINIALHNGLTPLMIAATKGNTNIVKILIKHGADFSVVDRRGFNTMDHARVNGHNAIVNTLAELQR